MLRVFSPLGPKDPKGLMLCSGFLAVVCRPCVRPCVRKLLACERSSAFKFYPILFIFHICMYDHKISDEFDFGPDRTKTTAYRRRSVQNTKNAF